MFDNEQNPEELNTIMDAIVDRQEVPPDDDKRGIMSS